ncbi:MAG: hypothetical protein A2W73_07805 [Deltaproteobacteria bacterium RIFCSPLOWO2_12_55_13]|nr:MAG: hypothetical protein A2W73_07805 [Deltaproteobacteria bacterium RIFCSPLOWO2_12_55_13]
MEIASRPSFPAYLFLFLPPLFWSSNFILGRALVDRVPPWTLNTGRFVVAAVILIPLLLYRQGWPAVPRKFIVPLVLMSLTGVFAFNAVLYTGLHYTTAINATLVNAATPVTTAGLAWLLIAEKMTGRRILGIFLSFAGIGWIVSQGSLQTLASLHFNPGDIIIFFATALWGFYCVMAKPLMQYFSPLALTAMTTGIGAVFLLPAAFFELSSTPAQFGGYELLAILYLGIFPSFLSFLLWNRSVLTFGPGRATLVYNTIPFFAIILSAIFLGERLMLYQGVGGAVIIVGVVIGTSDRVS